MGVTCQILINKTREGVFKAGGIVTGVVKYAIDEPTEYKDVKFSFLGKGKCRWTEQDSDKSSTTYTGTEDYIQTHVNITNKKPEENITLETGVYEYPFEFYIPEDVPTTYKSKNFSGTGWITYCLQLKFVKSQLLSFNKVFTAEIPVYGTVDSLNSDGQPTPEGPLIFGLQKSIFALFATKKPLINLRAEIAKTRFTPGENAHLSLTVTNNSNVAVIGVKAELYLHVTFTANSKRTHKFSRKVEKCEAEMPEVPVGEIRNYSSVVPTLSECYSIQNSRIISGEYRVRVTLRLPVPHMNASVEVPVAIGESKGVEVDTCLEACDDINTQPPSYWETMCEDKSGDWDVLMK